MADVNVNRLTGLGMSPELSVEVRKQIDAGSGGDTVTSVNGNTGDVVLAAADVGAATTAQGALASTAVQPADLTEASVASAATLTTTRAFSLTGDVTAPAINFNGSAPVALVTSIGAGAVVNANIADAAAIAGSKLVLTGYTIGTAGALAPADTVNDALGKLEARIAALETP